MSPHRVGLCINGLRVCFGRLTVVLIFVWFGEQSAKQWGHECNDLGGGKL